MAQGFRGASAAWKLVSLLVLFAFTANLTSTFRCLWFQGHSEQDLVVSFGRFFVAVCIQSLWRLRKGLPDESIRVGRRIQALSEDMKSSRQMRVLKLV